MGRKIEVACGPTEIPSAPDISQRQKSAIEPMRYDCGMTYSVGLKEVEEAQVLKQIAKN